MTALCGQMPSPSTADRGVERWIGSLEARPASRSQSPESGLPPTIRETSGQPLSEWWPRFSQWAASLRTSHQPTLFGTSTRKSSPDFQHWATKLRREYSARLRSARHISGSESSSWPTPKSEEGAHSGRQTDSGHQVTLTTEANTWPTPDTMPEAPNSGSNRVNGPKSLGEATEMWQTPMAADDGRKVTVNSHQPGLIGQSVQWSGHQGQATPMPGPQSSPSGPTSHRQWGTPRVTANGGNGNPERLREASRLEDQSARITGKKRLNPKFVTWLMGWPENWLDFHALNGSGYSETVSSRQQPSTPSESSAKG